MTRSAIARFAGLLPDLMAFALTRERARADRLIATGMRLGGMFAWAIEQVRFSQELAGPSVAASGWQVSPPDLPPPPLTSMKIVRTLPQADTSIVTYQAVTQAGEAIRLLLNRSAEKEAIIADARMVENLINLIPRPLRQISKRDLTQLIEDIVAVASVEADLGQEADGLRLGVASAWFEVPGLVSHWDDLLVETDLAGVPVHELSVAQRQAAYRDAVTGWTRMLLMDGILQVGLRRDRLFVQDGRLGVARWAGTKRAGATSAALVRNLALSAFGPTAAIRAASHQQASELLADGLGLAGDLAEIEAFCFSLMSEAGCLQRSWPRLSEIVVRERPGYSRQGRTEVLLLLRQLVWLRDLGLDSGVGDLTGPWRELTAELRGS